MHLLACVTFGPEVKSASSRQNGVDFTLASTLKCLSATSNCLHLHNVGKRGRCGWPRPASSLTFRASICLLEMPKSSDFSTRRHKGSSIERKRGRSTNISYTRSLMDPAKPCVLCAEPGSAWAVKMSCVLAYASGPFVLINIMDQLKFWQHEHRPEQIFDRLGLSFSGR